MYSFEDKVKEITEKVSEIDEYIQKIEDENRLLKASLRSVDDVLIVNWISPPDLGESYKKSISDLIYQEIDIKMDPSVSREAYEREQELTRLRQDNKILGQVCQAYLDTIYYLEDEYNAIRNRTN